MNYLHWAEVGIALVYRYWPNIWIGALRAEIVLFIFIFPLSA